MQLTDVVFTFYDIQGDPIADTPFTIQLIRSGFEKQIGVVVPTLIEVETDQNGQATVALAPSSTPYYVQIDGYGHCSKQSYKFYVPELDHDVPFQELIAIDELDPAVITDEKIKLIIEASILSRDSAAAAKEAKASEVAAKASEDNALASENAAKVSETNTKTSETNAKASETNAKASETAASGSAFTATNKATETAASASKAKDSEDHAKASEERTTALKDSVEATVVVVQKTRNDMESLYNQAVAIGSGWAPVMRVVADGSRYVLQVTDWTGGRGTKPATGYMGATGIVAGIGQASDIRGAKGLDGTSFTVNATGTLAQRSAHDSKPAAFTYLATDNGLLYIRETATSGVWSPGIPFGKGDKGDTGDRGPQGLKGDKGDKGDTGATGPVNKLTIGTVTTGSTSSATITGTAPNQILNLTLQKGDQGVKGDTGLGFTQAQYDKLDGIEAGAQKNVPTNLSMGIANATTQTVLSSTGTSAVIPQATVTAAGLLSATDKVKLNGAAPLASPSFTGTVNAPTAADSSDSTEVATTAFVRAAMKKNGMSDIFGTAVDRYINSTPAAAAPFDDCNTFPVGTRVLADKNFVQNTPTMGGNLWYIETIANYTAVNGRWQFAQNYSTGELLHRWATSNNVYNNWRQLMATDGSTMTGQLHVLNQLKDDNSPRAANTNFVHASYQHYGVNQSGPEASANTRLTDDGAAASNDFNAYTGVLNGGTYTIAGSYLNGPNGAAATSYTAVLHVVRCAFNAGPAVNQWFYSQTNAVFMRQGWVVNNVWTWQPWAKVAWETSNVASATKLQTARKITVGNTTKTFDGTGDISFSGAETEVTGPNLLYNTDFLLGTNSTGIPNYWTRGGTASTGLASSLVPYQPFATSNLTRNAYRISCTSSTNGQYLDIQAQTANGSMPVTPGTAYTLSTKFRATALAEYRTYIQFRNAAGTVISTINGAVLVATGDWQTHSTTGTAPADAVDADVCIASVAKVAASAAAMWAEVVEPQFKEGATATPYQPGLNTGILGKAGGLQSGTNWNALLIDGDYQIWNILATSYTNAPPTPLWGMLRVRRTGSCIYQEYLTDTSPYISYVRRSGNSGATWTAWASPSSNLGASYGASQVTITNTAGTSATIAAASTTQAGVMVASDKVKLEGIEAGATKNWTATAIPSSSNLNTYTTPGNFSCAANATASTLTNCPTTNAFSLNVYAAAGVVQVLTEYASNSTTSNKMWIRGIYSNIANTWQEVYTSGSPQLTTTTGAPGTNNTNIASTAFVQAAVSGVLSKAITGGAVTLTAAEASNAVIAFSGTLTSNATITFPTTVQRVWVVSNVTSGAFTLTVKSGTGNTVVVTQGRRDIVFSDGVGMNQADTDIVPVANGGTGVTTSTGSGAIVLDTSPAFGGTPTAPTAAATVNNTQLATTAYVKREVYTPNDIIEQRRGAVSTGQRLQTWGWIGKKASFALEMTADEEIQIISVDKETGTGKRYLTRWNQAGAMDVPTYVQGRTENVLWAPAVTQKLNIGGAFSSWANDGSVPVIQVDAADRNSAYMLWRATRWGYTHLAAMHFHETAEVNQMVSMSMQGGNGVNQFRWYSDGGYECDGYVIAAGVVLTSDIRMKDLHGGVTGALDKLSKISKVFYNFKGDTAKHFGYTAQSVEAVLPEAVTERDAQPHEQKYVGDKVKVVDYNAVAALQAQAIDELHALVKKQQAQIDSLMAALASR